MGIWVVEWAISLLSVTDTTMTTWDSKRKCEMLRYQDLLVLKGRVVKSKSAYNHRLSWVGRSTWRPSIPAPGSKTQDHTKKSDTVSERNRLRYLTGINAYNGMIVIIVTANCSSGGKQWYSTWEVLGSACQSVPVSWKWWMTPGKRLGKESRGNTMLCWVVVWGGQDYYCRSQAGSKHLLRTNQIRAQWEQEILGLVIKELGNSGILYSWGIFTTQTSAG